MSEHTFHGLDENLNSATANTIEIKVVTPFVTEIVTSIVRVLEVVTPHRHFLSLESKRVTMMIEKEGDFSLLGFVEQREKRKREKCRKREREGECVCEREKREVERVCVREKRDLSAICPKDFSEISMSHLLLYPKKK